METEVPKNRIRRVNHQSWLPHNQFVLYWMTAFRRTRYNFALQYARDVAQHLNKPLVILEALRVGYPWASDRLHRFAIEGMRDNALACQAGPALYYPYVEPHAGAGSGLLTNLAESACAIITDDYPCFFLPRMTRAAGDKLTVRLDSVDANGLMPLSHAERTFTVAHSYRRWMQKELPQQLEITPQPNPLQASNLTTPEPGLLSDYVSQWPMAELDTLLDKGGIAKLPIDHSVPPADLVGGSQAGGALLKRFCKSRLSTYDTDRNEPDEHGSSELSAYLHYGHLAAHEVFASIMDVESWHPGRIQKVNGKVQGFWGVSPQAEAFLDQLCTWREIGFNMCWRESDYDQLASLPDWVHKTIQEHADDPRPYIYSLAEFEQAQTHDPIWNAAQRQLVREGRIHNYMRMLWGKKILHWTPSADEALRIMLELNNKYALDGRDPNSYSGIFWVLGRYDRAWGPERPVFGKIRYMTSENTAKKHRLGQYLERFSAP